MSKRVPFIVAIGLLFLAPAAFAQLPVVSFSASSYTIPEKGTYYAYVHVIRSGDLTAKVSFTMNVVNLKTNQTKGWSWAFTAGESEASLAVNIDGNVPLDNAYYDPGRKWSATITSVTGGTLGQPSSTEVDVVDDDPQPQLSVNDISVTEGTSMSHTTATFTLQLTTPVPAPFTIPISVHDGTAHAGSDYIAPKFTYVTFGSDSTRLDIPMDIIADSAPEADETFTLEIGTPSNPVVIVARSVATCTIVDDDLPVAPLAQRIPKGGTGTIHVQFADPATSTETVQLLSSDAFLTFPPSVTIPAGSTSAEIDVGGTAAGVGTISVILPPSRGGRVYDCTVTVYDPVGFTIDPLGVTIPLGQNGNVTARIDPPPSAPITVALTQSQPGVADVPSNIVIDASGSTVIPLHALSAGSSVVTATLPDLNGGTVLSFMVRVTVPTGLAITSLSQRSGRASGGETLTLFGNFGSRCAVMFGGVPSQTSNAPKNGSIVVTTPPHDAGVVDVGIRCGNDSFVFPNAFTYVASPLTITDVTPSGGVARGGTIVTVRGMNLRTGLCRAIFGGIEAHAIVWSGTSSMTVVVPPHAPGPVAVTLSCGSETATLASGFTYNATDDPPATIYRLTPPLAAPGDLVILSGARFRPDDTIFIDGVVTPDEAPLVESDQHIVVVPELPAGNVALSLHDAAGRAISGGNFSILAPNIPDITQIDAHVTPGAELEVGGHGFRTALTFALGLTILQPVSITPTRALFRVPADTPAGPISFSIADHGAIVAWRPVDVTTGIAVMAVSPPCAAREGKSFLTISGSGFDDGAMVQFGSTYAPNVVFRDAFTLIAEAPPAFGESHVAITVTNPDGTAARLTNVFAYKSAEEGGCKPPKHHAAGH